MQEKLYGQAKKPIIEDENYNIEAAWNTGPINPSLKAKCRQCHIEFNLNNKLYTYLCAKTCFNKVINSSNINKNWISSKTNAVSQENNQLEVEPDVSLPKATRGSLLIPIAPLKK